MQIPMAIQYCGFRTKDGKKPLPKLLRACHTLHGTPMFVM